MRGIPLGWCLFGAVLVVLAPGLRAAQAPAPSAAQQAPMLTDADVEAGRLVYTENCARCHGPDGRGQTRKALAAKMERTDLTGPERRADTDARLFAVTTDGVAKSEMPAFGEDLDERQRWQAVAYVRRLQRAMAGKRRVSLTFRALAVDRFECNRVFAHLGRSGSAVSFADFRFYVHGVTLVDEQGQEVPLALDQDGRWQYQDVALIDFENGSGTCANGTPETRTVVEGLAADRHYVGARFVLGVPSNKNHRDAATAPAPLNLAQMFWSWNVGYKFLRLDAKSGAKSFQIHIGSTGCREVPPPAGIAGHHFAGDSVSCLAPNRAEVRLPSFDPDKDFIVADLASLLADSDLEGDAGCLSSPDEVGCAPIFRRLGLPFGDTPATPQSFFRVFKGDEYTKRAFRWILPWGFPVPRVPYDNPMTAEKVELGRHLFFDRRLSSSRDFACASCHDPARAFTDGRPRAVGVTGELHPRSAMTLANVAYSPVLTWSNPGVTRLEQQALIPMFGERPVEMGLAGREAALVSWMGRDPVYAPLFQEAFPGEAPPVTLQRVTQALACFERTLISGTSPYDRYRYGRQPDAISEPAKRGEQLFLSDRLECFHCHGGFNFTQTVDHVGKATPEIEYHNTGLYNVDGKGAYPAPNLGLFEFTRQSADMGRFKPPTLRNIAITAPYMHDGSIATLSDVIDHYAAGGRAKNPLRAASVKGFTITAGEKADLIAFLESLTDEAFLNDPTHQNPWPVKSAAAVTGRRPSP